MSTSESVVPDEVNSSVAEHPVAVGLHRAENKSFSANPNPVYRIPAPLSHFYTHIQRTDMTILHFRPNYLVNHSDPFPIRWLSYVFCGAHSTVEPNRKLVHIYHTVAL